MADLSTLNHLDAHNVTRTSIPTGCEMHLRGYLRDAQRSAEIVLTTIILEW